MKTKIHTIKKDIKNCQGFQSCEITKVLNYILLILQNSEYHITKLKIKNCIKYKSEILQKICELKIERIQITK